MSILPWAWRLKPVARGGERGQALRQAIGIRMLRLMAYFTRTKVADYTKAVLLWLCAAFSIGWFYVYTYDRPWPVPVPLPEIAAAATFYAFSPLEMGSAQDTVRWFLAFPLAAWLWLLVLAVTSPYFGGRKVDFSYTLVRYAMVSIPLSFPGPLLAFLAASTDGGLSWQHARDAAMFQAYVSPRGWIIPLYLALGGIVFIIHIRLYFNVFDLKAKNALQHLFCSVCLTFFSAMGMGTLFSYVADRSFS